MFFDEVLAFDHVRKQILLVVTADLGRQKPAAAYKDARQRLGTAGKAPRQAAAQVPVMTAPRGKLSVSSRTLKKDFLASVARIQEYIAAGDIFQAVLSQRFEVKPGVDPFSSLPGAAYRQSVSPYLYFPPLPPGFWQESLHLPGWLFSRIAGAGTTKRNVEYKPIAGTRPRVGPTKKKTSASSKKCWCNEKERAEHVMLVDLGRNDIGRVCDVRHASG